MVVQATALKLHASKAELEGLLDAAKARLEAGQPPTEERSWSGSSMVRQQRPCRN